MLAPMGAPLVATTPPPTGVTLFRSFIMTNSSSAASIATANEDVGLYDTNGSWLETTTVGGAQVGWQCVGGNFGNSQVTLGGSADPDKINGNIWIQDNRTITMFRIGYIPPGNYLADFAMGPGPENTASGVCDFELFDGSNRSGGPQTSVHIASRAEITTGGQYWDFMVDGQLFNATQWAARTIAAYPTGRAIPITISSQATTDLEGISIAFRSNQGSGGGGSGNYLRLNWVRLWTEN